MRKIVNILFLLVLVASVGVTSCKKKTSTTPTPAPTDTTDTTATDTTDTTDTTNNDTAGKTIVVTQNISADTKWEAKNIYQLGGRITVLDGVTLTIEPGTIIKGEAGIGANATALLVARGGKLMAEGKPGMPIIFTSVADEITQDDVKAGNFASPNLPATINGLWGGVLVCGKAKISASNTSGDVTEVQIEGIPTSDPNGLYGGNDDNDNSGVLKYISIRHGGTNIGQGNEINGLTLAGVGRGTIVENIEVVANQDDGVEWFGGTVNCKNVIVWNVGDDGIDTDQSWAGTLDNFIVITPTGHCFELDGPEGSYVASHTIKNGTVLADFDSRTSEDLINTDKNSEVTLENIFFQSVVAGNAINRTTDNPGVSFSNIVINVPAGENLDDYIADGTAPAGVTAGTSSSNKANASVFANWSWAAKAGVTSGL